MLSRTSWTGSLHGFINLAIALDNCLRERQREKGIHSSGGVLRGVPDLSGCSLASPATTPEEPMQLGRVRLTPTERERSFRDGTCLYCGLPGHIIKACPHRPKEQAHR